MRKNVFACKITVGFIKYPYRPVLLVNQNNLWHCAIYQFLSIKKHVYLPVQQRKWWQYCKREASISNMRKIQSYCIKCNKSGRKPEDAQLSKAFLQEWESLKEKSPKKPTLRLTAIDTHQTSRTEMFGIKVDIKKPNRLQKKGTRRRMRNMRSVDPRSCGWWHPAMIEVLSNER